MIIQNRRARHEFEILENFEAGISLTGSEVKSLREGGGRLSEAYARLKGSEVWLEGMHIAPYRQASYNNHEPERARRLLLHRREIEVLKRGVERKGLTIVPLKLYFKNGWIKIDIALARGKKLYDKRQDAAKRDAKRQMERALKDRG